MVGSPSLRAALVRFSTCDVSDALLKKGYTNGGFLPDTNRKTKAPLTSPIVGRLWTVQFVPKSSTQKPDFEGHYIDLIPSPQGLPEHNEGDFPVIPLLAAPSSLTNAVFGGIMAMRASVLQCPAVVVSGRIRDLQEMNAMKDGGLHVYATGTSTVGAGASSKVISIGGTCDVENFGQVETGQVVMMDDNGVVVIPKDVNIAELVELMEKLVKMDDHVKEDVETGMSVAEAFKKWRT